MVVSSKLYRQKDTLQADLLSLSKACPSDQSNPEDCPLFALRTMQAARRAEWIEALPEDDRVYLAAYHHVCFATRTEPPRPELRADL